MKNENSEKAVVINYLVFSFQQLDNGEPRLNKKSCLVVETG